MKSHTGKTSRWEIHLDESNTRVSLFSPLDKTIAIIHPKRNKGYILFILNCQSFQSSTEWYSFIRHCLNGPPREKIVTITVPDLDHLPIRVNTYRDEGPSIDEEGETTFNGSPISANDIIQRCMTELRKEPRYTDVLDYWEETCGLGLCWKRYDRIEWLTGMTSPDQDELAGSWSLNKVISLRPVLTFRLIILNYVLKRIIRLKSVSDLKSIWKSLFLSKAFLFDLLRQTVDKPDLDDFSINDSISRLTIICYFTVVLQRLLLRLRQRCSKSRVRRK